MKFNEINTYFLFLILLFSGCGPFENSVTLNSSFFTTVVTAPISISADYSMVGGGGAGAPGGGVVNDVGGGGGYLVTGTLTGLSTGVAYNIIVGAGGVSDGVYGTGITTNGSPSSFHTVSAQGGYAGNGAMPGHGGSGGGGSGVYCTFGGAGGSDGSDGLLTSAGIGSGFSTYDFRDNTRTLRSGGGGGGIYNDSNGGGCTAAVGSGGAGGGGAGCTNSLGGNGVANTGGGGGGGCRNDGNISFGYGGGNGGSGVVVLRRLLADPILSTTGTVNITTDTIYRYYEWITDGTVTF